MTKPPPHPSRLGPVATPRRDEVPTGTRGLVLSAIGARTDGATVEELSEALDVHSNSVRNHVAALGEAGLVDVLVEPPSGRGRPAHRFVVTVAAEAMLAVERAGTTGGGAEYRALAEAFARHLATQAGAKHEARAVGELWGGQVMATRGSKARSAGGVRRAVLSLLSDLGFAPTPDTAVPEAAMDGKAPATGAEAGSDVVLLRACPLLESAQKNPDVICSVHLGLVAGARRALGAADGTVGLEPFAQPGACRLTLPA
ncbi:MAG TPA: helix-turn-helix domain-containing protein [Phycicoccus sp.]|nr:helix-turn-helix domain-containing protein [Phycicoccus sp.]